jgi:protein TonB
MRIQIVLLLGMIAVIGASRRTGLAQSSQAAPTRVRVSNGVMAGLIKSKVAPIYPADAKAEHLSGSVVMREIISNTGSVEKLDVVSGPQKLQQAALDAVRQWSYRPYELNGKPVEVETTIVVNFSLQK